MTKVFSSLLLFVVILISSCDITGERIDGNGNVTSSNRPLDKAEKIRVQGAVDVIIAPGSPSIRVEADENLIPYIETTMEDNWLEIKTRNDVNLHTSNSIKVYVTTPLVSDLKLTGSGNITGNGKFATNDDMTISITGSGDIRMEVNAPKVEADVTGSGNLHIAGETQNLDINVTGSGNYEGQDLKAENAVAKVSGSGDINLFADSHLKATVNGSGNIKYKGSPNVDSHVAGSGSVAKVQ